MSSNFKRLVALWGLGVCLATSCSHQRKIAEGDWGTRQINGLLQFNKLMMIEQGMARKETGRCTEEPKALDWYAANEVRADGFAIRMKRVGEWCRVEVLDTDGVVVFAHDY